MPFLCCSNFVKNSNIHYDRRLNQIRALAPLLSGPLHTILPVKDAEIHIMCSGSIRATVAPWEAALFRGTYAENKDAVRRRIMFRKYFLSVKYIPRILHNRHESEQKTLSPNKLAFQHKEASRSNIMRSLRYSPLTKAKIIYCQ